jgi:hypothetical protein
VTVSNLRELAVAVVITAVAAAVLALVTAPASPRKGDRLAAPWPVDIGPAVEVVARPPPAPVVLAPVIEVSAPPTSIVEAPPKFAPEPPRAAARPTDICARHGGWRVVTDGGRSWHCAYRGER